MANTETLAIENFINFCDDMQIAEEGVGDVIVGILVAPYVFFGFIAAIASISTAVYNKKDKNKAKESDTLAGFKLNKRLRTAYSHFNSEYTKVMSIIKKSKLNTFSVNKEVYEKLLKYKKSFESNISLFEKGANIIQGSKIESLDDYAFTEIDTKRDTKIVSTFEKQTNNIDTLSNKLYSIFDNIENSLGKFEDPKKDDQKVDITKNELLNLMDFSRIQSIIDSLSKLEVSKDLDYEFDDEYEIAWIDICRRGNMSKINQSFQTYFENKSIEDELLYVSFQEFKYNYKNHNCPLVAVIKYRVALCELHSMLVSELTYVMKNISDILKYVYAKKI